MNHDPNAFTRGASYRPKVGFTPAIPNPQRHSRTRTRWQPEPVSLQDLVNQCSPCDASHPYLVENGITEAAGWVFNGTDVAGMPCRGAYVIYIHDKDRNLVNLLFKVQNAEGVFEDLFATTLVAGCSTRIGKKTPVIVIAVDFASGMAVHLATGHCVAVVHFDGNLLPAGNAFRTRYPHDEIVIAVGARCPEERPAVKNIVVAAARACHASVALPDSELSFAALFRAHGVEQVASGLHNARHVTEGWAAPQQADLEDTASLVWPHRVHAGGLLAQMCNYLAQYSVLPFSPIYAIALWILFTRVYSEFQTAPVLALLSLTRRCGKTVTLNAVGALVRKFEVTSHTTAAWLFDTCAQGAIPGLDEADQYLKKQGDPITPVVNAGHTTAASRVTRKGKKYEVYGPKLISGIGTLPSTIMDRSIVIPLIRKSSLEKVERFKAKGNGQVAILHAMMDRLVLDREDEMALAEPEAPDMINDRAADNWAPLFAIASCAGPKWLQNAREAASDLTPGEDDIPVILEEFISDMVAVFLRKGSDFIATADLIAELCREEDKPWSTYSRGMRPMSIHDLGKLMREAKVKVGEQKHDKSGNRRGYYRRDVEHLFDGYARPA